MFFKKEKSIDTDNSELMARGKRGKELGGGGKRVGVWGHRQWCQQWKYSLKIISCSSEIQT